MTGAGFKSSGWVTFLFVSKPRILLLWKVKSHPCCQKMVGNFQGPSMDVPPSEWNLPSSIMLGKMVRSNSVVSGLSLSVFHNLVLLCLLRLNVGFLFYYLLVFLFSWFGVCAPCFADVDVRGPVCAAARAGRIEILKETKALVKRKFFLVINCCCVFCLTVFVLLFPN